MFHMRYSLFGNSLANQQQENRRRRRSDDDDITEISDIIEIDADSDSDSDTDVNSRIPRKQMRKQMDSIVISDDPAPSTSQQQHAQASSSSKNDTTASSSTDKTLSAITTFIIEDLHTLSIVKDSGFKKLMATLSPDLILPTQDDILNHILLLYGIERSNLLLLLHSIDEISIAIERWTSFSENRYATIKANFINVDWEPQSYVLSTIQLSDTNSLNLLNDKVLEVLKHWEIENKIVSTVYDWYRPPMELLSPNQYQSLGKQFCCFALKLQMSIDGSFDSIPEIKAILEKCKRLVGYFLHSNESDIYLYKYQKYLELPCSELIQASPDEMNSTYLMLDRLLAQKLAIVSVLRDTDATDPAKANDLLLNDNEWATIKEIVSTLKPFQLAKVVLYRVKDHIDSVSVVKPMIYSFCTNFLSHGNETPSLSTVRLLKQRLKDDLLTKFQLYVGSDKMTAPDYFDLATYLDPRYKNQEYLSEENRNTVKQYIQDVYFEKDACKSAKSSMSSKALSILFPSAPVAIPSECARYHAEPEIDKNLSPHKWWELHQRIYPTLSHIAKRYLCTHSTSKSIFTSRNASLRRKNLTPQIVDKLIFLNHKFKFDSS